jgi:hypothetical protein
VHAAKPASPHCEVASSPFAVRQRFEVRLARHPIFRQTRDNTHGKPKAADSSWRSEDDEAEPGVVIGKET